MIPHSFHPPAVIPGRHAFPGSPGRLGRCGFSLVEVILCIGIVAFAFVAILGLLPVGLGVFRQSVDNSLGSQIVQRLVNEAQQTDFPTLTLAGNATALRYFDDQGNEVPNIKDSIYTAQVAVAPKTTLPSAKSASTESLATVTVRLAHNPGQKPDPFATTAKVTFNTYTAFIAKNQ